MELDHYTFQWHIHCVIFAPKITGIGQVGLLLKLYR